MRKPDIDPVEIVAVAVPVLVEAVIMTFIIAAVCCREHLASEAARVVHCDRCAPQYLKGEGDRSLKPGYALSSLECRFRSILALAFRCEASAPASSAGESV